MMETFNYVSRGEKEDRERAGLLGSVNTVIACTPGPAAISKAGNSGICIGTERPVYRLMVLHSVHACIPVSGGGKRKGKFSMHIHGKHASLPARGDFSFFYVKGVKTTFLFFFLFLTTTLIQFQVFSEQRSVRFREIPFQSPNSGLVRIIHRFVCSDTVLM